MTSRSSDSDSADRNSIVTAQPVPDSDGQLLVSQTERWSQQDSS